VNDGIIKAERPVVAKFARAITEAIHYIKADKETTKAKAAKQIGLTISRRFCADAESGQIKDANDAHAQRSASEMERPGNKVGLNDAAF
jgi:ABC-type nitrate/sulfonate/bicarbonate transport system substrate-binding protein